MRNLAIKIQLMLVIIASCIAVSSLSFFYYQQKQMTESLIANNIESIANSYFDGVNTMMLTGTMSNRHILQQKILNQKNITEAKIIRGEQVKKLYGAGSAEQIATNSFEKEALVTGNKSFRIINQNDSRVMQVIWPMKATSDYAGTNCLGCHQANEGDVLGAVKISYDLSNSDQQIEESILTAAALLFVVILVGFLILGWILQNLVFKRLNRLKNTITNIEQNLDLNKSIKVYYDDEIGAVSKALNKMMTKFRDSFVNVSQTTTEVIKSARDVNELSQLTKEAVLTQRMATESVAAAMNQLEASAAEVVSNTQYATKKSEQARLDANQGQKLAQQASLDINTLATQVQSNSQLIEQLGHKTTEVGSVLEVITKIADQTNLLALNAAIEAARAGEQGRGFAVVADEVRLLATRTSESIEQIKRTIDSLQQTAVQAVDSMQEVSRQADEKAQEVTKVATLLTGVSIEIEEIDQLNSQISDAAQQQNLAADEINNNVTNISDVAERSSDDAIKAQKISEQLLALANELQQQVGLFKL